MSKERKKVLMDIISSKEYKPLKLKGFKILLGLENEEIEELEALLKELVTEGKLILTNKKVYS